MEGLITRTRERDGTSILLTFHPHPQKVISSPDAPSLLSTQSQKEEMLRRFGIDIVVRLPFTRELSLKSPEQFVQDILCEHGIREIHVGSNFRFGHRRSGDFHSLQALGRKCGFEVYAVEQVRFRDVPISSTRVRNLIKEGRVALAKRLLGRPYQIRGTIVRGTGKGAQLGIPTANLEPENELIPATGVYVTQAVVDGSGYPSVTNIGYRPTLHREHEGPPIVETHLLDCGGDLYGKHMMLDFCLRLRAEKKFDGVAPLKKQIEKDIEQARKYFACPLISKTSKK